MKPIEVFPPASSNHWQPVALKLEKHFMQRNAGKSKLSRRIRCISKYLIVRMLEKTY